MKQLTIKGAKLHNLKNIHLSIPKNELVVATGISGSGKSSLIFDTIFEEGKKLYLDSIGFSTAYRDEDAVDQIYGIAPTVAVMQKVIRESNPRSLVGTKTGILPLLATLFSIEAYYPCSKCGTAVKTGLPCPECGEDSIRLQHGHFLFNSPKGVCYECEGRGYVEYFNEQDFIDEEKSVRDNWGKAYQYPEKYEPEKIEGFFGRKAVALDREWGISIDIKMKELPRPIRKRIIYDKEFTQSFVSLLQWRVNQGTIQYEDPYYGTKTCPICKGSRLGIYGQKATLFGKTIGELGQLDITSLLRFLLDHQSSLSEKVSKRIFDDLLIKLENMIHLGLHYLNLYRKMPTLSGGEIQRLLIMHHLENELEGLIYIFDEPTAGLHESEKQILIQKAIELKNRGNSVFIVEHDLNTIQQADHIIEFGPGAGSHGGEVVFQGNYNQLKNQDTHTGRYASGKTELITRAHPLYKTSDQLHFKGITINNLFDVNVTIPLGAVVGICGVSGSGKSSLINQAVVPSLKQYFKNRSEDDSEDEESTSIVSFSGGSSLDSISVVNQAPIGRTGTSTIATYLGVWDNIRNYFAKEIDNPEYKAGSFSFNSAGACPRCAGRGIEITYLSNNVTMNHTCRSCHGNRYKDEILGLTVHNKNIADVLNMTISEAVSFFKTTNNTIYRKLKVIEETGMGYITIGQTTPTISGGEAQRLKLAKQLATRKRGRVLYIFDEPTTGLSMYDINQFLSIVNRLYEEGNSILIIEHDPGVLSFCSHLIEMGPKGGSEGGKIIASGTPQQLVDLQTTTGKYLKVESHATC